MPGTGDARTPIPADADVFTPDAVEAIRAHMNADHAHDNLVICRAHGAPGARRAELRTVDASGLTFAATTGDGTVVVHVFLEAERRYYDLEGLWSQARLIYHSGEAETAASGQRK